MFSVSADCHHELETIFHWIIYYIRHITILPVNIVTYLLFPVFMCVMYCGLHA